MTAQAQASPSRLGHPRWRDLREWLELVESIGALKTVAGATSEADIGAITEMVEHADGSPAVLFEAIPGFQPSYRVLSNSMGTPERLAITLGLDHEQITHQGLIEYWRRALWNLRPLAPTVVDRGPILENVLEGDKVDLGRFPAPIWHPKDGGRFIGTASINIMRDPDTGFVNGGTYRNQVFDRNSVGIRAVPPRHGGIIRRKHDERGEPTPIAIVVGSDPLLFMGACLEGIPYGQSELDWAGAIRGEPIEVIKGELTGLPIPAHAEIALEGFITLDEFHKEGPYGEWMGFYQDGYEQDRVIRIERVYHRNDPVLLGCPQGKPPHEDNRFLAHVRSGMIWNQLEHAGVPGVRGVWSPPEAGNRLMTVVAIEQQYPGHAKQAALIASQCAGGVDTCRLCVVVDDNVDVTSLQDVMWAILTRCDPARGVDIIDRTRGSRIDMAIDPDHRHDWYTSRMIVDATTPYEWKDHPLAGDLITSPAREQATRERWGWILA